MPIVTLSSDIGQRDFLVGAIKGQFLQLDPTSNLCDITHYLPQTNFPQAAYVCGNAIKHYPGGSFHLILVNLFCQVYFQFRRCQGQKFSLGQTFKKF